MSSSTPRGPLSPEDDGRENDGRDADDIETGESISATDPTRSALESSPDYLPSTPLADTANSAARMGGGALPTSTVVGSPLADVAAEPIDPAVPETRITNKTLLIIRRLLRNKGAVLGLVMLALVTIFALFGNTGNQFTYLDQDLLNLGSKPGEGGHRLGTNGGGIDLWAMLVRGTGKSLLIAFFVGVLAPLIGAVYGTAIAFWGGRREKVGMWILDMLILMPYFLIVAVFMGATGGNALILALLLTAFGWMGLARVIRATTASLREREFVKAAQFMGVSDWNIIRRHIIPNIGSLLIVNIITGTYSAIIAETALSFLGVGVRPPDVSLGALIGSSASQLSAYPWLFWGPTVALLFITFSLALIGDGLRDALDPNSKSGGRA